MRATYIGTPDDDTKMATVFGIAFIKGVPVQVSDKHPKAAKFAANGTFVVAPDKPPTRARA